MIIFSFYQHIRINVILLGFIETFYRNIFRIKQIFRLNLTIDGHAAQAIAIQFDWSLCEKVIARAPWLFLLFETKNILFKSKYYFVYLKYISFC